MPVHVWTENTYACSFSWVLIGYNIDGMLSCSLSSVIYVCTSRGGRNSGGEELSGFRVVGRESRRKLRVRDRESGNFVRL